MSEVNVLDETSEQNEVLQRIMEVARNLDRLQILNDASFRQVAAIEQLEQDEKKLHDAFFDGFSYDPSVGKLFKWLSELLTDFAEQVRKDLKNDCVQKFGEEQVTLEERNAYMNHWFIHRAEPLILNVLSYGCKRLAMAYSESLGIEDQVSKIYQQLYLNDSATPEKE